MSSRVPASRIEAERKRLAVTIESLGDGLLVTEPGSSTIATVNPRATELVPELKTGAKLDSVQSPFPPLDGALGNEAIIDHRGRALAVTAARLGDESDSVVWTVHDMSERARLERAKSEFVAMASHELRSPLTSIKGFVELLDRSSENMSERQREFVDIIHRSTDRLVELVNDLLDVARIEADRVEIDRRPIDVGEAVREVVELMGPRFEEKSQHLGVYLAPTLPLAFADSGRVRQIVANLLTNAHLYTGEGGRIQIGVEPERAWVQIVVADSGVGMTPEELRARVRALLPSRRRRPLGHGHGARPVDRQVARRAARRADRGRERAGTRHHLPRPAPAGPPRTRVRALVGRDARPAGARRRRRARDRRADRRTARPAAGRDGNRRQR